MTTLLELRDYQVKVVDKTRDALRRVRRVLVQLPTGGGKTAIASYIIHSVSSKGKRAWFLCHRDFLVDQTGKTFNKLEIHYGVVAGGQWYDKWPPVHIGMVQTVRNRVKKLIAEQGEPDYVVWDEAHHISAATWAAIMDELPNARHIGLSATPQRLDGRGLDSHFDELVVGPSVAWLMEKGYLCDYTMYAPSTPDMTGAVIKRGDYTISDIDAALNKSVIVGDIVGHYQRLAKGLRAVYFCHNIDRSKALADAFTAAGFPAKHLDANALSWERKNAAIDFADGKLAVLTNVDLFGEGYDLAAQAERDVTIEAVGLCRPTQSLSLHLQQIGRVLRPKEAKAIVLDHAGNWQRHGLPDDHRQWSLKGTVKQKQTALDSCEHCGAVIKANSVFCPICHERLVPEELMGASAGGGGRQVDHLDGELREILRDKGRGQQSLEELQASSLSELRELAERRGYPEPYAWAAYMWTLAERRRRSGDMGRQQQMRFYEGVVQGDDIT